MHFIIQIAIAAAVLAGAFWAEDYFEYPINPHIKGAWAFMAAYGYFLACEWLARRLPSIKRYLGLSTGTD